MKKVIQPNKTTTKIFPLGKIRKLGTYHKTICEVLYWSTFFFVKMQMVVRYINIFEWVIFYCIWARSCVWRCLLKEWKKKLATSSTPPPREETLARGRSHMEVSRPATNTPSVKNPHFHFLKLCLQELFMKYS